MVVDIQNGGQEALVKVAVALGGLKSVSAKTGIHQNQLRHYFNGDRRPLIPARNRLKKVGVGFHLWEQSAGQPGPIEVSFRHDPPTMEEWILSGGELR
jgi:hypothetical protein